VGRLRPERFEEVLTPEQYRHLTEAVDSAREFFQGRKVWNVNSTATGGGVAEMLRSLLAYICGAGIEAHWVVIAGTPEFFRVTKRIHNHLHGSAGDGGSLDNVEEAVYRDALEPNGRHLKEMLSPDDVVLLHDPQTAGLIPVVKESGAKVVWRCHVGLDMPNELAREAWRFLTPFVSAADAYVFSREVFAWEGLDKEKTWVIPPSIDAFSPKNQDLEGAAVLSILHAAGILDADLSGAPEYSQVDGSPGRVSHRAQVYQDAPISADTRLVVQVSRWDTLKDPVGVLKGFAEHVPERTGAHLVLAGPAVEAVSDDPEGAEVLRKTVEAWKACADHARRRIHLACLPMDDGDENAAIVNALQRQAHIVVQKSLAEGFGLTVAEAMWKARPVVASRIGGIQDQVDDGVTGILVDDPRDLAQFGSAVTKVLDDDSLAARLGEQAQRRVRDHFLGPRHLLQYVELIGHLYEGEAGALQPP
jgi:trehalose synthase